MAGFQNVVLTDQDDQNLPDDMSLEQIIDLGKGGKPGQPEEIEIGIEDPLDTGKPHAVDLDDDGNEIEIIDDTPDPRDRGRPAAPPVTPEDDFIATEAELQTYRSNRTRQRVENLAKRGHEERRAKEEAIRRESAAIEYAKTLAQENAELRRIQQATANAQLTATKDAAEARMREAQAKYKDAVEKADPEEMAVATAELSRASAFLAAIPDAPRPLPPPKPAPQVSQYSERMAGWLSRNQWFATDQRLHNTAMGYHHVAVAQGLTPDSEQYYAFIDRNMSAHLGGPAPAPAPEQRHQSAQPKPRHVAPVNPAEPSQRATPAKGKIVLTQSQRSIADALGVPYIEYAKQLQQYDRSKQS